VLPWPACDRHSLARLFSSASARFFHDRPAEQSLVARHTTPIGSLAISSRDLQLYSARSSRTDAGYLVTWSLIAVAAHVQLRDGVAYSADLEQIEIPAERGLLLQMMLVDPPIFRTRRSASCAPK
jgi:hypothetical protein